MTDYSTPITDKDLAKAKTWYDIVCWGGLLIVLLPVGIANLILGYLMGDSPCTLQAQVSRHDARHGGHGPLLVLPPSRQPCGP